MKEVTGFIRAATAEDALDAPEALAIDPICGMPIGRRAAPATAVYRRHTYCFCSSTCRDEFERIHDRCLDDSDDHTENHRSEHRLQ